MYKKIIIFFKLAKHAMISITTNKHEQIIFLLSRQNNKCILLPFAHECKLHLNRAQIKETLLCIFLELSNIVH